MSSMRIAVISDIHGNYTALESVLEDLKGQHIDQMVCLGDAIQGGPQPGLVLNQLRAISCPVVMGNADAWLLSGVETGDEQITPERRIKLNKSREWALGQLSMTECAQIAAFPATVCIPLSGGLQLVCGHGSPSSFDTFIFPHTPQEEFLAKVGEWEKAIITGGHTHVQFLRRYGDGFFFNPGSVGVAYSHFQTEENFRLDPWAEYAILTVKGMRTALEFHRVPFDTNEVIRVHHRVGHPYPDDAALRYSPKPVAKIC